MPSQNQTNQIIIYNTEDRGDLTMNTNKNQENNLAFIDGQNLYLGTNSA